MTSPSSAAWSDPEAMLDHSRRFAGHADSVHEFSQAAYNSAQAIAGAGWTGHANVTSTGSVEQITTALGNIRDMMHWASTTIQANHDQYVGRELDSARILST